MRDRQAMQRAQLLSARLHLIGLRGGGGGHFGHQSHDRIHLRVDTLDLLQVRGQRFASGQLFRADQPGHLDGAHETHRRGGRLSLKSARESSQSRHSQQDFAAGWKVLTHGCSVSDVDISSASRRTNSR